MRAGHLFLFGLFLFIGGACLKQDNSRTLPQDLNHKYDSMRQRMVKTQIESRDVKDEKVLNVMRNVPRHLFVPKNLRDSAYDDTPLPIGSSQTISQPYIVALMTETLHLAPTDTVLEIGTGSGYQAAVLAELVSQVYTIEIVESLCQEADARLQQMGYKNIKVACGDGYQGWPEYAPFDGIIVTAAPPHIPEPLIEQLKVGGRMIIPVGDWFQELILITKTKTGKIRRETVIPVRFVPMTGEAQRDSKK